jgi:hypothetical protein
MDMAACWKVHVALRKHGRLDPHLDQLHVLILAMRIWMTTKNYLAINKQEHYDLPPHHIPTLHLEHRKVDHLEHMIT